MMKKMGADEVVEMIAVQTTQTTRTTRTRQTRQTRQSETFVVGLARECTVVVVVVFRTVRPRAYNILLVKGRGLDHRREWSTQEVRRH